MNKNYSVQNAAPQKVFPFFDMGNFVLREKLDQDIESFFNYYSDPEVNKYILCKIPQNIEEAKHELYYWRQIFYYGDGAYFAIADKISNKMIGSIGISGYNKYQKRIEISYDLAKEYWRLGITYQSLKKIIEYSFNNWDINRIEASVAVDNIASKNLLLKVGFTMEGILREHRYHRGRFVDVYFFSFLKKDLLRYF